MYEDSVHREEGLFSNSLKSFRHNHQYVLDQITPHVVTRWIAWFVVVVLFLIRIFLLQGWYIVTYGVGIFILNQFIAFLTPKIDPALLDCEEDEASLPTKNNEEFRPFMRQLPELKFWYSTFKCLVVGIACTFFDFVNIPVFWPILVVYFITLFLVTMKKQIKHMVKYKYLPFSHGKVRYSGKQGKGRSGT